MSGCWRCSTIIRLHAFYSSNTVYTQYIYTDSDGETKRVGGSQLERAFC